MTTPDKIYLKDYTPPPFFIDQADLTFDIGNIQTKVCFKLKIRKNKAIADDSTPLVLDRGNFKIVSVVADGMILMAEEFEADDEFFKLAKTPDNNGIPSFETFKGADRYVR